MDIVNIIENIKQSKPELARINGMTTPVENNLPPPICPV
jgi:hypothetical protein